MEGGGCYALMIVCLAINDPTRPDGYKPDFKTDPRHSFL
jgi:hypothetical protein